MSEPQFEYDPEVEELDPADVNIFEGQPDFENSPTTETDHAGGQDDGELPPYAGGSDA